MDPGIYIVIFVAIIGFFAIPISRASKKRAQSDADDWDELFKAIDKNAEQRRTEFEREKDEEARRIARAVVDEMEQREIQRTNVRLMNK